MEVRLLVFLSCMGSLCTLISIQSAFPLLSFPIISHVPFWTRLDQANMLASHAWAEALSAIFTVLIVRSYGARPMLISAHAWQAYFALYMIYARSSFYEFWMNRFFSSLTNGMIYGGVFHALLHWLPSYELFSGLLVCVGTVGVGWILGVLVAWGSIVYYQSWHVGMIILSMLSLCMSLWWWRCSRLASYPHTCPQIPKVELSIIHSNRFRINQQDLRENWSLMLCNRETLQFSVLAYTLGYVLYSRMAFHSIYYLELASLQSEVSDLPLCMYYPWVGWIVVCMGGAFACMRKRSGSLSGVVEGFVTSPRYKITMGCLSLLGAIILRRMESFPTWVDLSFHLTPLFAILAAILSLFLLAHLYCQNLEPEVCLAVTLTGMAVGGVVSQELGGLILEMAGAWEVMFRYESNALLFFSLCHFIPWLHWRFWRSRKSLRTSDNGFL